MLAHLFRTFFCVALVSTIAHGRPGGFVSTRGRDIVGPDGAPLLLRGISLGNWLVPEGYMFKFDSATSPRLINGVISELVGAEKARMFWKKFRENYITRDDIRYIKGLGLNSIRVPFNWRLFTSDEHPEVWTDDGFVMLDRVITWCREAGIWVVLDMHCAPGGQTGDNIDDSWGYPFLFDSPEDQLRTIELWKKIAARYKDDAAVVGYDLFNEPIAHFLDTVRLNPLLEPLYKRIVAAIRHVDTNHIVFLGGAQWDTNFRIFGPPFDSKSVFTFHRYWCDTTQSMIDEYVEFGKKYNVPLWLGESGENTNEWIASFRRLLERNNIGWCFWPYKKMDAPRGVVTFNRPEGWDIIVRYANSPRSTYEAIRASRPPADIAWNALEEFVKLSQLMNCRPNEHYIEALLGKSK
jgi:endoglucanase